MKNKLIEKTAAVKPRGKKKEWQQTIQEIEDILVINSWFQNKLVGRHCINTVTREFATLKNGIWRNTKIEDSFGMELELYSAMYYQGSMYRETKEKRWNLRQEDEKRIFELLEQCKPYWKVKDALELIAHAETEYLRDQRLNREERRQDRVRKMMERVPGVPKDWKSWIDKMLTAGTDWFMKSKNTGYWHCSACGGTVKTFHDAAKIKDGQTMTCPLCEKNVMMVKRKRSIEIRNRAHLIQPIDDQISVARHFVISASYVPAEGEKKEIDWSEEVRLILNKDPKAKKACDIYWAQWSGFDNKGNPTNRRMNYCYIYDGGIKEAFRNTDYEPFAQLFTEWAAAKMHLDYNNMMIAAPDAGYVGTMEMLYRGRFYKLLEEESSTISTWSCNYTGPLEIRGRNAGEVLGLRDKQKVNRLREKNGGHYMLTWLRWSEEYEQKISDAEMKWLEQNAVLPVNVGSMTDYMSLTQIVNYIERQKRTSYIGWKGDAVISQYHDYIRMCERLKKHLDDEMVFRPRELKRRHDEAVKEIALREAELQAEEYSEKYKEAEAVLQEIREKFEYAGKEYTIKVPNRIVEIVREGKALHHCAGATERYFDRIKQHETYICFLRKNEEPDKPFYTIEVEPGGTIRQHRGYMDEEPGIEKIKPFLRAWQREIKKKMSEKDHELAAVSKVKREANIEELKAKNNTRVLKGLMEDFMEVI